MSFFAVDGQGDPNTAPAYAEAMELLHGLSFTVKMSKMGGEEPEGYFEYVVPPLEGLWWTAEPGSGGGRRGCAPTCSTWGPTTRNPPVLIAWMPSSGSRGMSRTSPPSGSTMKFTWATPGEPRRKS